MGAPFSARETSRWEEPWAATETEHIADEPAARCAGEEMSKQRVVQAKRPKVAGVAERAALGAQVSGHGQSPQRRHLS